MELGLLKDILVIFALSSFVNFLFTRIRVPTIIGYLLTGVIAGPYLLGLVGSPHQIELMAEIGVVLLMFTIGLEFSVNHLLKIRKIVFAGGLMQLVLTAGLAMLAALLYRLDWQGALFVGFLTALSSTAVVLKLMQERSEVTSNYGRTVVGILIFQDIVVIPMLLFTPLLGGAHTNAGQGHELFFLLGKTVFLIGLLYLGNRWLMPGILRLIAHTRNQELFMMSIFVICLAVALLTSEMGISLAFGAFLGGLMISESEYSHQAFGQLIPFKDIFTSFFFVSIGMMLDLGFVAKHTLLVLTAVVLVMLIKILVGFFTAFSLGHTLRGTIMAGLALGQVGEFSFILART
ncbi:MAG: cation:proton antiporter, partial [Mangrovibacterium sp.]